jgi:hypothetical protein
MNQIHLISLLRVFMRSHTLLKIKISGEDYAGLIDVYTPIDELDSGSSSSRNCNTIGVIAKSSYVFLLASLDF